MRERINFLLAVGVIAAAVWAVVAWALMGTTLAEASMAVWIQRAAALVMLLLFGGWLAWRLLIADRLPDHLREMVGEFCYEVDGVCFMPVVRAERNGLAELCIYYQNRFENPVNAVVHLRPPVDSFAVQEGTRDVHIAFRASGGDFGCIRQGIAVPNYLQGEVVPVELAAACHYPRGQGNRLRSRRGMPCGSLDVDWQGAAFRTGVHEVSGEIELVEPTEIRLCMPNGVKSRLEREVPWRQECIAAGAAE